MICVNCHHPCCLEEVRDSTSLTPKDSENFETCGSRLLVLQGLQPCRRRPVDDEEDDSALPGRGRRLCKSPQTSYVGPYGGALQYHGSPDMAGLPVAKVRHYTWLVDGEPNAKSSAAGGAGHGECEPPAVPDEVWMGYPLYKDAITVRFSAKALESSLASTCLRLLYNDSCELSPGALRLGTDFGDFTFEVPQGELLWNLVLLWAWLPGDDAPPPLGAQQGIRFNRRYGIEVHGLDLSSCLRMVKEEDGRDAWARWGRSLASTHSAARVGRLETVPARYVLESSLELMTRGATGRECIDVYVNGMPIPCQRAESELPDRSRLHRFVFAPACCSVCNVVVHVWLAEGDRAESEKDPELIVDPSFGVMLGGQDILPSVMLVDPVTGTRNPRCWQSSSAEWRIMKSGRWACPGHYQLVPGRSRHRSKDHRDCESLSTSRSRGSIISDRREDTDTRGGSLGGEPDSSPGCSPRSSFVQRERGPAWWPARQASRPPRHSLHHVV